MSLLEARNLNVAYRSAGEVTPAVKKVSFGIREREIVSLVGESGSGKSTLGLAIGRLLPGSSTVSGEIDFRGEDILKFSPKKLLDFRKHHVAYVFQEPAASLNPVFRVRSQINECLIPGSGHDAEHFLKLAQIRDETRVAESYPHELSGGMKQRVMIAMALAKHPELLIADEPTTALDVTIQKEILEFLVDLRNRKTFSILLITHDLHIAFSVSDRVLIMKEGEIVEEITDPRSREVHHPYSKLLLNCLVSGKEPKTYFDV